VHYNKLQACFLAYGASGQDSILQLRGTILHEAGHVLAGQGAGHDANWKASCLALGLDARAASGQDYAPSDFEPALWAALVLIPEPADGRPAFRTSRLGPPLSSRGRCKAGVGTRGGVSHRQSRLRKYTCACPSPKVYVTSAGFEATCKRCGQDYQPAEETAK